jgi:uncharacterized protein YbjT (DUF2867 family)
MKRDFAGIILGGTGQVGGAAVAELLAIPECREVVMVTLRWSASNAHSSQFSWGIGPRASYLTDATLEVERLAVQRIKLCATAINP